MTRRAAVARGVVAGAVGTLLLASAPAAAMSVAEFLPKAEALAAKGMMAMFSSDLKPVTTTGRAATTAWRSQAHRPNACPPPKISITSDDFLALLRAVPPAQRATTTVRQAVTTGLNRRFPCPA